MEDTSTPCDVCVKKGEQNVPAVIYCTVCRKLFCRNHEQVLSLFPFILNYVFRNITWSFYLIYYSKLRSKFEVCSKFIENYYKGYLYMLILTMHSKQRLGGVSATLKRNFVI